MTEYVLVDLTIRAAAQLNSKGQCCGRKPIAYRRQPHLFCCRCDRAYAPDTREQIENWAWKRVGDGQSTTRRKVSP